MHDNVWVFIPVGQYIWKNRKIYKDIKLVCAWGWHKVFDRFKKLRKNSMLWQYGAIIRITVGVLYKF